MANRPTPPLRPINQGRYLDADVRPPNVNEAIMARLPFEVTVEYYLRNST